MKKLILTLVLTTLTACQTDPVRRRTEKAIPSKSAATKPSAKNQNAKNAAGADKAATATQAESDGRYVDALKIYLDLSVDKSSTSQQETSRQHALNLIDQRMDEGELRQISNDSSFGFLRGHALFRLGQISLERSEREEAKRYFTSVVSFLPGSDLAVQAAEQIEKIDDLRSVEPKTIGVILPLSGKNASVGQRALRGIQLGLGMQEANSSFTLAIMDSAGNPDAARRGVERLVREDNVIAIIGSLLSRTAPAVSAKAQELGVPVIGLSQRQGLTETGPVVFRNALTAEMQVRQLVRSAMDDMGIKRFAILAPNDAFGMDYANIFWDEVLARGGSVTAAQIYDPTQTDFRAVTQRLVGSWYIEGRYEEYKTLGKDAVKSGARKKSVRQEKSGDDVLPPIVDFEAVFIPDSAKMMGTLSAFLSYAGVRNVKLLGTNLWNTPDVAKRAGLFANQLVFVDSWLPSNDPSKSPRFVADYQRMFKESPTLIEIQAYESALILRSLVSQGASTREQLTRRLTDLKGFPGVLGPLEMDAQREVRRPLMTYQTSGGQIVPLRRSN